MKKILLLAVVLSLAAPACGGRLPKPKTAGNIVESYFHRYGRKFKTSDFGQHKVDEVAVLDTQEIHKHLVAVTAQVKFQNGPSQMIRCTLEKKALGWRFVSWEKL